MNEKVLSGIRRVRKCLLMFCWMFFGLLMLNLAGQVFGDRINPIASLFNMGFFIFSYVFYSIVSAFLNGYDGKEE